MNGCKNIENVCISNHYSNASGTFDYYHIGKSYRNMSIILSIPNYRSNDCCIVNLTLVERAFTQQIGNEMDAHRPICIRLQGVGNLIQLAITKAN